ncbi:MAG: LON peptidase substrate-binding domain-containing protein [Alphaproteobacteria bacterium]
MSADVDSFNDLPASIPVFPLSGVLLLPRGMLPLNIFEPRYRNMTSDALANDRIIGIIQPVDPEEVPITSQGRIKNLDDEKLPLYSMGCAGKITSYQESEDGQFQLSLTGICRFKLGNEIQTTRGYRRFEADWSEFESDYNVSETALDRRKLLAAMRRYFEINSISVDWTAIEEEEDEWLINALSMSCPFTPAEKQALLEAENFDSRCVVLTAIAEMASHALNGSDLRPQ